MKRIHILPFLTLLFLFGCSEEKVENVYNTENFDSKQITKLYSNRVGVAPPNELLELWDKNWNDRKVFSLYFWGDFEVLYPDKILKETLVHDKNINF